MAYVPSSIPYLTFDLGTWHGSCPGVRVFDNPASGVPWLYCPDCRCLAQADLVCPHITPESSAEVRNAS